MLFNERVVLEYIKDNLGSPKTHLELLDEEILKLITHRGRLKFSTYHPVTKVFSLTSANMVPEKENEYIIPNDPDTLEPWEIISVEGIYTTTTSDLAQIDYNHSIGATDGDMMSDVNNSLMAPKRNRLTYNFYHPNRLVSYETVGTDTLYVKAKMAHDIDCTTIPINLQEIFLELCLIIVAKNILPIRDKYSRIGSPIGDIQLNIEFVREIAQREESFFREKLHTAATLSKRVPLIIA